MQQSNETTHKKTPYKQARAIYSLFDVAQSITFTDVEYGLKVRNALNAVVKRKNKGVVAYKKYFSSKRNIVDVADAATDTITITRIV